MTHEFDPRDPPDLAHSPVKGQVTQRHSMNHRNPLIS